MPTNRGEECQRLAVHNSTSMRSLLLVGCSKLLVASCVMARFGIGSLWAEEKTLDGRFGISEGCWDSISELRDSVISAETAVRRGAAARRLFERVGPSELVRLICDSDHTIAMLAKWCQISERTAVRFHNEVSGVESVRVRQEDAQEFLGFVQARLRVQPPLMWSRTLRRMRLASTTKFDWAFIGQDLTPTEVEAVARGIQGSDFREVWSTVPEVRFFAKLREIHIRPSLFGTDIAMSRKFPEAHVRLTQEVCEALGFEPSDAGIPSLAAVAIRDQAVIMEDDRTALRMPIVSVGAESDHQGLSKLLWKRDYIHHWGYDVTGGGDRAIAELVAADSCAIVFISGSSFLTIEALRWSDGATLWSFCTVWPMQPGEARRYIPPIGCSGPDSEGCSCADDDDPALR